MKATHAKFIWAIARNTIAQAIRVRVAFVIMAVYLVLAPALFFLVEGDGTLGGLLVVGIRYSLMAAGVLLGLLTLVLSTTTLWSEIHEKQIYLLESRPVRRWHLLLGKLTGILVVNAALLVFVAIVNIACIQYLIRQGRWTDDQKKQAHDQVLTARRTVRPEPPSEELLTAEVNRRYEQLKAAGRLPVGRTEADIKRQLRKEYLALTNVVLPRRSHVWMFRGVTASRRRDVNITVRFKYTSSDTKSDSPIRTIWRVGRPNTLFFYTYRASRKPREFHEIAIPADAIDESGNLAVQFINVEPTQPVLDFSGEGTIQVLIPVTGFVANLARGLFLILIEVLFLGILGLFCSTFLTFPVSPIVALALLLLISLASSVQAQFEQGFSFEGTGQSDTATLGERIVKGIATTVRCILPPLDRYAAAERVSSGKEVPWLLLLEAAGLVAVLRGGVIMLLGIYIFERRELALAER